MDGIAKPVSRSVKGQDGHIPINKCQTYGASSPPAVCSIRFPRLIYQAFLTSLPGLPYWASQARIRLLGVPKLGSSFTENFGYSRHIH
jgi:hypothetical protein